MNKLIKIVVLSLSTMGLLLQGCASAQRYSDKGDVDEVKRGNKWALISFVGNTVITSDTGVGALVTGVVASKNANGGLTIDQQYIDQSYEMYVNALKEEGYSIVPVEAVLSSKAYQVAKAVNMPTYKSAKGLKHVNWQKTDSLKEIAHELNVDRLIIIENGHGIFNKGVLGSLGGKTAGEANINIYVFNNQGERLLFTTAAEESETSEVQVAGGFQDPKKVMPMLKQSNQKLARTIASKLSKK